MDKKFNLDQLVRGVSKELAVSLAQEHPRLKGLEDYLDKNLLDKKAIANLAYQTIKGLSTKQKSRLGPQDIAIYLIQSIQRNPSPYLTERGKESILRRYEKIVKQKKLGFIPWGKGVLRMVEDIGAKKIDRYVNDAVGEFGELAHLAKKYDGAITPQIANLLNSMYSLGFAYEAIDVMQHYKDISGRDANKWREAVHSSIKRGKEEIKVGVAQTVSQFASAVLLIASFLLLGFSAGHMTGFVIASNKIPAGYPIGAGFILLLIAFCLSFIRKKGKNQQPKKKAAKKKAGRKFKRK